MSRVLFLSNHFITLYSFRKELINRLLEDGHEVFLSLPEDPDNKYFEDIGCNIVLTEMDRRGVNPFKDLKLIKNYKHIINEINKRIKNKERVMIVTLTIKMAEDLTSYLKDRGYKVTYLHNETKTLERSAIIYELRKGKYDILVGINLLREGLDIPEVSLICILDADKEGFLRSTRSLIQIIGRTARNKNGQVIMYADHMTDSMKEAIKETNRRRAIQEKYNKDNGIIPETIIKEIRLPISNKESDLNKFTKKGKKSKSELTAQMKQIEKEMRQAAKEYNFERAAELRDILLELRADNE